MFECGNIRAYLIFMTFTAISKSMLLAIGVSLVVSGCATSDQPALNTAPSGGAANVTASTPSGGTTPDLAMPASTDTAPAPRHVSPAQSEVVTAEGGIVVPEAPPEMPIETRTMAPATGMVWVPGGWGWRGRWVWERGYWVHPPTPNAVWVPAQYIERNGRHIYIPGAWK